MCIVHMFLLGSVLTDKKWGWVGIINNVAFISFIYYQTLETALPAPLSPLLGSPTYALVMHLLITVFLGGFLASTIRTQEQNRQEIERLQCQKIGILDEAVRKRTEQLNNIRQTIATDFHDQTGNMLAAINRQASTLEMHLCDQPRLLSLVKSITANSSELYASSRDFIWNLNHESDNPQTLFQYLTSYGQNYYNQFDIAFSAGPVAPQQSSKQLDHFAALNLIYILKEAMGNVVRHSDAEEVVMSMVVGTDEARYVLTDNDRWKDADPQVNHYGLKNMERRCRISGFGFELTHGATGTCISITVPLATYHLDAASLDSDASTNHREMQRGHL